MQSAIAHTHTQCKQMRYFV